MSDVDRRTVCADDDGDLDRARFLAIAQAGDVPPSTTTGKRARSRSPSSSAQAPDKLARMSAMEGKRKSLVEEQASSEGTHHGGGSFVMNRERSAVQGKEEPGIDSLYTKLRADVDRTSLLTRDSDRPDHAEASRVVLEQSLDQLRLLSREASDLGLQQQRKMLAAERLQERLAKSERTYGELLREFLELQRSIEERRKQMKLDKQELEKERAEARTTGDRLCTVLAAMNELSQVMSSAEANQSQKDMTP